jgi:D-3-phosphoglycerate dehydrogenase
MSKVVVTDYTFPDLSVEEKILKAAGATEVVGAQARTWEEVAKVAEDADAVITQFAPVNAQAIAAMKKAKVISRYGIGVDNVDLAAAKAKGIAVCNIPDYCIDEVADHTLAFILAITRQVVSNALPIRNGEWKAGVPATMMRCLRNMTVGAVAFGRIGREVVKRLVPFGCKILVFDPVASKEDIAKAGASSATLDEMYTLSDLITLHCPSVPQTRGMLNKAAFAKMKKGVLIVNASRGDLIVTDDLIEALRSGQVDSAALDVTSPEPPPVDSPLRSFPQVIIHSHIASVSVKSVQRLREGAAQHAARALRGEKPVNVVNGL